MTDADWHLASWQAYIEAIPWAVGSLDSQEYSAFRCAREHDID
jgi:hypothetical protein